jgi:hypothetical protein
MAAVSWLASLIHHHAILPVLPRSKEFLTGTHWIINNGSPATAMPPFDYLTDEEIWQLVIYLRSLVDHKKGDHKCPIAASRLPWPCPPGV